MPGSFDIDQQRAQAENMRAWPLLFFIVPIVEMYLLIEVGGYIGALWTIGLVMLTAVIGVALLRHQGLATLTRGVRRLNRGEMPAREMAEGILLAVAGALLLTPGFVTDGVGFVLLAPVGRQWLVARMLERVEVTAQMTAVHQESHPQGAGTTIEGDFERRP